MRRSRALRVAFATIEGHPADRRVWSGTPQSIVSALAELPDVDVEPLGPVARLSVACGRLVSSVTRRTPMGRLSWEVEPVVVNHMSSALARHLERRPPVDAVVTLGWAPVRGESLPPVVFWGDATIAQRVGEAPHWASLSRRSQNLVERTEGRILRSLDAIVMPSSWAAQDIKSRYGIPPERVHVVPFGANLPVPRELERASIVSPVRLLTVGVDWYRKGFDRSVTIADQLVARGHRVVLDVVGAMPPDRTWLRDHVKYHGFIDTSEPEGQRKLNDLYEAASLFLLPSRHDPFPIVLAEAASFGLPSVATAVAGIPDRVVHAVTGIVLDPGADAATFAEEIERLIDQPSAYSDMAKAARQHFLRSFRWPSSVRQLLDIVDSVVD